MKLEFIRSGPALVIENEERLLVVSDLHFGIEADLAAHGLHFASRSTERLERLMRVIDLTDPDRLILLGDIKHSIPSLTRQEYHELPGVMETLRSRLPLLIFPGNHDIGIERFAKKTEICPRDGALINGIAFLHGHMNPAPDLFGNLIVVGHHHPLLALRDEVGCALQEPAYIRAGLMAGKGDLSVPAAKVAQTRLLFMPAFNELAGYDISRIVNDPFSPLSRCMDSKSAEIILADGTYIGPFSSLVQDEDG
ncbi:metallophosphoesterase [Methanoregula sp.]|uniref:metallophosphoesterase n=1 Tax=Methanoregula sp. TaxID=2052170 RepID=UPI00261B620A|nr:metallophosphoesterase [Methanoregula sp.]MDD5143936.1 metallophosphoesterase [Methanoregula sp.]